MRYTLEEDERIPNKIAHDKAVADDEREAEQRMQTATKERKAKTGKIVDKLADGKALTVPDLNYLATPAVRLEYMNTLRERGHDPQKFADMFDVLHQIALNPKTTDANRLKAANAYIARTRELYNLDGETDKNTGVTNVIVIKEVLIAGGQQIRDPVQSIPKAEIID